MTIVLIIFAIAAVWLIFEIVSSIVAKGIVETKKTHWRKKAHSHRKGRDQ